VDEARGVAMTGDGWLHLFAAIVDGALEGELHCPRCDHLGVRLFVDRAESSDVLGYGVIGCQHCERGRWLSRIRVPGGQATTPSATWPNFVLTDE
jgi:hypothetical protein